MFSRRYSKQSIVALVLVWTTMAGLASGWTPPTTPTTDRKGFLQTTGTAAMAAAAAVSTNLLLVHPAPAATTPTTTTTTKFTSQSPPFRNHAIYQPPPMSLTGQVHVITGASTGLGLESAKRLAAAGATVVLTARTNQKGERAKAQVLSYLQEQAAAAAAAGAANNGMGTTDDSNSSNGSNNNNNVYYLTLDLDHFDSIRSFPKRYKELMGNRNIDVLMNNAGMEIDTRQLTDDGFERTFQSNHLGPFLLTAMLFPYLQRNNGKNGGARVINVSSVAHQLATTTSSTNNKPGLDLENLNGELYNDWGGGWPAYAATKLENILFTQELQRRADGAGMSWLTTVTLHPGVVGTDIWRNTYVGTNNKSPTKTTENSKDAAPSAAQSFLSSLFYKTALTTEEGANTQIWLASAPSQELAKGTYYNEHGQIKRLEKFAQDPIKAKALWEVSEKLTGIEFQIK